MLVPCSTVLEFNTDICKSSLPWVIILLFRLIFMCVSVSSHLCLVNMLFLIVLYILFFFRPTNLSISSPHRGAETKLNCLLLFTTFLIYLTADTKVCTILLFVFRGLPLHAMKNFNDLSLDFEVPEDALLSLREQSKVPLVSAVIKARY